MQILLSRKRNLIKRSEMKSKIPLFISIYSFIRYRTLLVSNIFCGMPSEIDHQSQ